MTADDVVNAVVALTHRGWSQRRIANDLGLSRGRVRRIQDRNRRQRQSGHSTLPTPKKRRRRMLDLHEPFMEGQLETYPDITAVKMHEKLAREGFDGGMTAVKDWLRARRKQPKKEPVRRFETGPGEQGQMDWSPYGFEFSDGTEAKLECFSLVLCFSRRQYIDFCEHQDFYSLIRHHVAAFEYFGGVMQEILYDNQKTVVIRWELGTPIYNVRFLAFATHYGFRPRALPPRRPELKGKVEALFQYVEGNCLNAETFRNLAHLREHARWWMQNTSDLHIHDTTGERPIDRFQRERDHLMPLPRRPYDTAEVGYRVISEEGFIEWDTVRYSVPYAHILELAIVRDTGEEIVVYGPDVSEIARHERAPRGHEPVVEPAHHPRKVRRNDIDVLTQRIGELGDVGVEFAAGVLRTQRCRGAHLAQVLAYTAHYALDDLVRALQRAVRYGSYDARTVLRILQTTAQTRTLPDTSVVAANQRLAAVAAQAGVTPRAIDDYARALRKKKP